MVEAHWQGSHRVIGDTLITEEGGIAMRFINNTGAPTVKGTVVECSPSVAGAIEVCPADAPDPVGIMYQSGVANGDPCWVVISGCADVLIMDTTAAALDYWVKVSDTVAGRADATNLAPPGGAINAIEDHFTEIGHVIVPATAGVDQLARIVLHFN